MRAPRRGLLAARPRSAAVARLRRPPGRGEGPRSAPSHRGGRRAGAGDAEGAAAPSPRRAARRASGRARAFPGSCRRSRQGRGGRRHRGAVEGGGDHRAPGASSARRLRPTASISLHGAVGSGPRGCAGAVVPCRPRTPPSPRWIGAAGPARRRPRSVSRQRRRGRAGREQVRRRRCRPRTGASEQTDPRLAQEPGWEQRWLSGSAAGDDPQGGPVSQNTPTAVWNCARCAPKHTSGPGPGRSRRAVPRLSRAALCRQQRWPRHHLLRRICGASGFNCFVSWLVLGLLFNFFIMLFKC